MNWNNLFVSRDADRRERRYSTLAAVFILPLSLAACSPQAREPSSIPSVTHVSTVSSGQSGGGSVAREDINAAQLRDITSRFKLKAIPQVREVRRTTAQDQLKLVGKCMADAGFAPTDPYGQEYSPLPDQREAFGIAYYICFAKYPLDKRYNEPVTTEGKGRLYDYWMTTLIPCFEKHGINIPRPPSKETWLQAQDWYPEKFIPRMEPNELAKLNEDCGAVPPVEVLYGK